MQVTDVSNFLGITNTRKIDPIEPEKGAFDRKNLGQKKVYLSWEKKPTSNVMTLSPRYKRTFLIVGIMVGLLLILMKDFGLILVFSSAFFFAYALTHTTLDTFTYEINTHGLLVNSDHYYWDEIKDFFITKNFGSEMLAVDLISGFPTRIFLAFHKKDLEKIIESMNRHVQYIEEEPMNFLDKMYVKVIDKFDFEQKK